MVDREAELENLEAETRLPVLDAPTQVALIKIFQEKQLDPNEGLLLNQLRENQVFHRYFTPEGNIEKLAAWELLTLTNMGLIVKVAEKYANRGLDFSDLVQEGRKGLHKGCEGFDHTLGFAPSTYLTWWIRAAINHAVLNQGRSLRLSIRIQKKISFFYDNMYGKTNPEDVFVSPWVFREAGMITKKEVNIVEAGANEEQRKKILTMVIKNWNQLLAWELRALSLDTDRSPCITLHDRIEDRKDLIEEANDRVYLEDALALLGEILDERELSMLIMKINGYGITEIGNAYGVTRQRVNQIFTEIIRQKIEDAGLYDYLFSHREDRKLWLNGRKKSPKKESIHHALEAIQVRTLTSQLVLNNGGKLEIYLEYRPISCP